MAGHVASMGESRGAYRVLVSKPEGNFAHGRPSRRWGRIILRWIIRKWVGRVWTDLVLLRIGTGGG